MAQDGRGDLVYGPVPVQLGRSGHETPTGRFHVGWKTKHWTSMQYGCVHLSMAAAQKFFGSLPVHAEVFIA